MNALDLANTVFHHPIRDIAAVVLTLALCAAVVLWPGWAEVKFRAVGVACLIVGLCDWARQLLGWDRRRP